MTDTKPVLYLDQETTAPPISAEVARDLIDWAKREGKGTFVELKVLDGATGHVYALSLHRTDGPTAADQLRKTEGLENFARIGQLTMATFNIRDMKQAERDLPTLLNKAAHMLRDEQQRWRGLKNARPPSRFSSDEEERMHREDAYRYQAEQLQRQMDAQRIQPFISPKKTSKNPFPFEP